jgi:hypothetical protein
LQEGQPLEFEAVELSARTGDLLFVDRVPVQGLAHEAGGILVATALIEKGVAEVGWSGLGKHLKGLGGEAPDTREGVADPG